MSGHGRNTCRFYKLSSFALLVVLKEISQNRREMDSIKTTSTSKFTAEADDILLKDGDRTRLIFRPSIVENHKSPEASVRGYLIYQRKSAKNDWEDISEQRLNELKSGEGIRHELHSEEVLILYQGLTKLYELHRTKGVEAGVHEYVEVTNAGAASALLNNPDLLEAIDKTGPEFIRRFLDWLNEVDNPTDYLNKLKELDIDQLNKINSLLGLTSLRKALDVWNTEKNNNDEEFWQKFLTNNSWVISQVFAAPLFLFKDKAYVGGKSIDNTGGKVIDYVFAHVTTHNLVLVEIKTPGTPLLGSEYRKGVYPFSSELMGAINQGLHYKDSIQKNYRDLVRDSQHPFRVFSPKCLIIAGSVEGSLDNQDKINSFELTRNELRNVEVISFDELFRKVAIMIHLLEAGDGTVEEMATMEPETTTLQ